MSSITTKWLTIIDDVVVYERDVTMTLSSSR